MGHAAVEHKTQKAEIRNNSLKVAHNTAAVSLRPGLNYYCCCCDFCNNTLPGFLHRSCCMRPMSNSSDVQILRGLNTPRYRDVLECIIHVSYIFLEINSHAGWIISLHCRESCLRLGQTLIQSSSSMHFIPLELRPLKKWGLRISAHRYH